MQLFYLTVPALIFLAAKAIGNRVSEVVYEFGVNTDWNLSLPFWFPQGVMYYMMNLFQWRLMAPYWKQLRYPFATSIFILCLMPYTIVPNESGTWNSFLAWDRLWSLL